MAKKQGSSEHVRKPERKTGIVGWIACPKHGESAAYVYVHKIKSGKYLGKICTSKKCSECLKERSRLQAATSRTEMLVAYGGKCVCCGESNEKFLTIDHIFGDGQVERNGGKRGGNMYFYLKKLGFPKDRYRLLCMNCNWATGRFGQCPHRSGVKRGEE